MTRVAALSRRLRRCLTERLTQLNTALTDLTARLRSAAATRFADHVAAVVREAVEEALAGPTVSSTPPRPAYHDPTRRWADRDDWPRYTPSIRAGPDAAWPPHWADEEDERSLPPARGPSLFASDPYEPGYDDDPDADSEDDDEGEPDTTPASARPSPSTPPRVQAALVLGLQASAWWLGRRRRTSLLMALAVGAAAGTLVLFGGPLLDAGIGTFRALLSLTS
jgi:hypothetical protein